MAQFNYDTYLKQQANRKQKSSNSQSDRPPVHFFNEWLKEDGDTIVVRFPYRSMDDIFFESVHKVNFPNEKFPRSVRCAGDDCPLCKQGVRKTTRFFVKAVVYDIDPDTGKVSLLAGLWDRPAAFADIELKNLFEEYGDLSDNLFKIKRNGTGIDTRYIPSIIMNKTVYSPDVYVKDFSVLENIDPANVMSKSMDQYLNAIGKQQAGEQESEDLEVPAPEHMEKTSRMPEEAVAPMPEPVTQPEPKEETPEPSPRVARKYTF